MQGKRNWVFIVLGVLLLAMSGPHMLSPRNISTFEWIADFFCMFCAVLLSLKEPNRAAVLTLVALFLATIGTVRYWGQTEMGPYLIRGMTIVGPLSLSLAFLQLGSPRRRSN